MVERIELYALQRDRRVQEERGGEMSKIVMTIVLAIWYIYGLWEMKR